VDYQIIIKLHTVLVTLHTILVECWVQKPENMPTILEIPLESLVKMHFIYDMERNQMNYHLGAHVCFILLCKIKHLDIKNLFLYLLVLKFVAIILINLKMEHILNLLVIYRQKMKKME
jgi:hypothetical protein